MKKLVTLITAVLAAALLVTFAACDKKPVTVDKNTVFLTATDSSFDFNDKTLLDYLEYLKQDGQIDFEISDGMVTSFNGKKQTTNSYWMLYTDDAEHANEAWGTLQHDGKTYGSATLGVGELPIKEGCNYIWSYQTF